MNFEKKMQKRGNKTLDKYTPDLYPNNHSFPLWAKISIPVGGTLVASAIAVAVVLTNLSPFASKNNMFVAAPKRMAVVSLNQSLVNRTASKTLESLDPFLKQNTNSNYVISPASYLLAVSGLVGVSDGFNLDSFGLDDAMEDCKTLLESWNFLYETNEEYNADYCRFDSGVLFQQVGPTYAFDVEKQKTVADRYIATSVATLNNHHEQVKEYYREKISLNVPIPEFPLMSDGVIAYSALKMKDYVANGLNSGQNDFYIGEETIQTDSYIFGSKYQPLSLPYYEEENYEAFELKVNHTNLLVVLPRKGIDLESIAISEVYNFWKANNKTVKAYGYVPFFHTNNKQLDITPALQNKLNGKEVLYSKLIRDDITNDLKVSAILQSSDFEFNKYGVSGESITAIISVGASVPVDSEESVIELNVDRPFYAISLKDDYPLFVNKVVNPKM